MGKKDLTIKQDLFVKNILSGKSGKLSAITAGYSERSAESIASENLRKPKVLKKIKHILDEAGLSDEKLAEYLSNSIKSGVGKSPKNSDALKGVRLAYELKGELTKTKTIGTYTSNAINFNNFSDGELKNKIIEAGNMLIKYQSFLD